MNDNERMKNLEDRVAKLEEDLSKLRDRKTIPLSKINKPISPTTKLPMKKETDWEKKIGQVWLPRIFIFVLLLGVIWGFKAGTEMGFINDYVRIGAVYIAGCLILFMGHKQWRNQNIVLGQVLLGGAIAIFFITTFTAHILYDLIQSPTAFTIHIVVVLVGFLFTKYYQSQSIGIVSSIGACLVPFLIQSESGNLLFFALYELIIFVAYMILALSQKLKALYLVVTYGLHLCFLVFAFVQWNADIRALAFATLVQHMIIVFYFLYRQTLKEQVAFTFLTSSVLMSLWFLASFTYSYWLTIHISAYLLFIIIFKMDKKKRSVFLSSATLTLLLLLLDLFEQSTLGLFLIIEGSIVIYLNYHYQSTLQRWVGFGVYVLGVISILSFPIERFISIETLAWTVLMSSFLFHFKSNQIISQKKELAAFIKILITFLGLIYLSQLSLLLTNSLELESIVLSLTWIIYAAANVIYGQIKQDKLFRLIGMFMIVFTLLKVIFIDLPTVSILIRAILFLLVGGIGLAISRLFYRKDHTKDDGREN
ncbi:DUF2339 domain-containing protein [Alkalihalobacillus deserti]|uniref:DUF2339 domain-containing protein n=1 Tax=Alkalihalobacillus deserti TaxID=2879466 RepID=UPI001D153A57|nr:DUF2339 domain-containing protein [Alkalihalobacillus deserti]